MNMTKGDHRVGALTRSLLILAVTTSAWGQADYSTPYCFTTLGGTSSVGSIDGAGSDARFFDLAGVAVDLAGNLYVADTENHTIRKITSTGVVSTFAGKPGTAGSADGTGNAPRFNRPFGVALDLAGNLYVTDTYNFAIRRISPTRVVTTLAGAAGSSGHADGTGSAAQFNRLLGITVDSAGNLFATDSVTIRKITPAGTVACGSTRADAGSPGSPLRLRGSGGSASRRGFRRSAGRVAGRCPSRWASW
jgi:DNA-binding beta-propeller fold protein YncE